MGTDGTAGVFVSPQSVQLQARAHSQDLRAENSLSMCLCVQREKPSNPEHSSGLQPLTTPLK